MPIVVSYLQGSGGVGAPRRVRFGPDQLVLFAPLSPLLQPASPSVDVLSAITAEEDAHARSLLEDRGVMPELHVRDCVAALCGEVPDGSDAELLAILDAAGCGRGFHPETFVFRGDIACAPPHGVPSPRHRTAAPRQSAMRGGGAGATTLFEGEEEGRGSCGGSPSASVEGEADGADAAADAAEGRRPLGLPAAPPLRRPV